MWEIGVAYKIWYSELHQVTSRHVSRYVKNVTVTFSGSEIPAFSDKYFRKPYYKNMYMV